MFALTSLHPTEPKRYSAPVKHVSVILHIVCWLFQVYFGVAHSCHVDPATRIFPAPVPVSVSVMMDFSTACSMSRLFCSVLKSQAVHTTTYHIS